MVHTAGKTAFRSLPPNVMRRIAGTLPLRNATRLAATSKNVRSVVSQNVRNRGDAMAAAVSRAMRTSLATHLRPQLATALRVARMWHRGADPDDIVQRMYRSKYDVEYDEFDQTDQSCCVT